MSTILNVMNLQTLAMKPVTAMQVQGQCFVVKAATVAQQMQAKKPLKRLNSSKDPEALRCKRRIDFTGLSYTLPKEQPATVARRNQRERNRVKLVNLGFETLREHVPQETKSKKMSKVDTLRSAVDYIRNLQGILEDNDAINVAFSGDVPMSPVDSLAHSPTPSLSSESSWGPLSAEEEDLLDFANWF